MPILELHGIIFEWHDDKFEMVYKGREISFEEVCSVFLDPNEITTEDRRFDYDEVRYLTIGMSNQIRLLAVVWTYREGTHRIVTAFEPSKSQITRYNNYGR